MAAVAESRQGEQRYSGASVLLLKISLVFFVLLVVAGTICWFLLDKEGIGGLLLGLSPVPLVCLFIFGIWAMATQHEKDSAKYFVGLAVAAQRSNDQMDALQIRAILSSLGTTYRTGLDDGRQVPALQSPTDAQLHPLSDLDANGQDIMPGNMPAREPLEGWYGGRGVP